MSTVYIWSIRVTRDIRDTTLQLNQGNHYCWPGLGGFIIYPGTYVKFFPTSPCTMLDAHALRYYNVRRTLYTVHRTLYDVRCTLGYVRIGYVVIISSRVLD